MAHLVITVGIIVTTIASEKTHHLPSQIYFELKIAKIFL